MNTRPLLGASASVYTCMQSGTERVIFITPFDVTAPQSDFRVVRLQWTA